MIQQTLYRIGRRSQQGSLGNSSPEPSAPDLADLAQSVERVEARIQRLRTAVDNLVQLNQAQTQLDVAAADRAMAAQEIQQLEQQVTDLEVALVDHLQLWHHLREPFWQAVRFGGLGIVLGWLLRGWVG